MLQKECAKRPKARYDTKIIQNFSRQANPAPRQLTRSRVLSSVKPADSHNEIYDLTALPTQAKQNQSYLSVVSKT